MGNIDYLPEYLTSDQLEAITHQGSPLLIIAGPGSGKTEVITWRAAHLVRAGSVKPENLLVTTFTNKAADQLKDRIAVRLPGVNVEAMQVSTIHSFCSALLRRYRRNSPLSQGFRLLEQEAQLLFVYAERKALGLDEIVKGRLHAFFDSVVDVFNLATEELVEPDGLLAWCDEQSGRCAEKESDLWQERHVVAEAYCRYVDLLKENGLVDFAFLQKHALTLVEENPEVLTELQERYLEILVDEYQDTNAAQDRLFKKLAGDGKRLTVVGDDDQSIYRFRGATVKNIISFTKDYPDARVVRLTHNFRSRKPIVDHSMKVIEHNPERYEKALQSTRGEGSDVLLIYESTVADEAQAVVDQIRKLHTKGFISRWGDVAILLRSVRSYAEPYLQALEEAGIPYLVIGDASFFDREEIVQLYNLFSFLSASKPWGDKFLRTAIVNLSDSSNGILEGYKEDLLDVASENGLRSIGLEDERDVDTLLVLLRLKQRVQAKEHESLLEVFYALLSASGCVSRFEKAGDEEALANLGVMSQLIANWDSFGSSRNFYAFQRYLKMLREGGVDPVIVPPEDAVQVMTIHQAKGLEFPVVVLGSAMNGRLPSAKRKNRYEVPYAMRASGNPEVEDPHTVDERKLFYVAVTRSQDLLIIGTADVVNKRGGGPSIFLFEMFGDDLKEAADITKARIEKALSHGLAVREVRRRYSYSDIAYYLQCPMRYKFAAIYGFEAPWLDPVGFGANVHRALEVIHQDAIAGRPPEEEEIAEILDSVWMSGRTVAKEIDRKVRAAAIDQIQRYIREHRKTFDRALRSEDYFAFPFDDWVLNGKFDLIRKAENGDGVEVVDFKTSSKVDPEAFGIDMQLDLYAMGVERDLSYKVEKRAVHFLRDGEIHSEDWSSTRETEAKERVGTILTRITAEDYAPKTSYCVHCDEFKRICPYSIVSPKGELAA